MSAHKGLLAAHIWGVPGAHMHFSIQYSFARGKGPCERRSCSLPVIIAAALGALDAPGAKMSSHSVTAHNRKQALASLLQIGTDTNYNVNQYSTHTANMTAATLLEGS